MSYEWDASLKNGQIMGRFAQKPVSTMFALRAKIVGKITH